MSREDLISAEQEVRQEFGTRHAKRMQYEIESGRGIAIDGWEVDFSAVDQEALITGAMYSEARQSMFRVDIPKEDAQDLFELRNEISWLESYFRKLNAELQHTSITDR